MTGRLGLSNWALLAALALALAGLVGAAGVTAFVAALPLTALGIDVHTTRRGKFPVWAEILDSLRLPGDERVLDVGCGCSVEEISINRGVSARRLQIPPRIA